jgi:hypothetical protein
VAQPKFFRYTSTNIKFRECSDLVINHTLIKMLNKLILTLPLLSLILLGNAGPLEQREAVPGLIDDLLDGVSSGVAQLIKDVLSGAKSGIDDFRDTKPLICLQSLDQCCVCKLS